MLFTTTCLREQCLGAYAETQHYSLVLLCFQYLVLSCCQEELLAGAGRLSLCGFHGVCPAHGRPAVGLKGGEVP